MPAKNSNQTPLKKGKECGDLLFSTWCVTDRHGLYIHNTGHLPFTDKVQKSDLTKIGTVEDIAYSAVYQVQGDKTPVFKLKVYIPEWDDEPETWTWYVVREIDFRDFSAQGFREEYLDQPEKQGCENVDPQLLLAWSAGVGGTKGNWFKNWFNKNDDKAPSAQRNKPARSDMPSVFGGIDAASSTTLPIQQPNVPAALPALPGIQKAPANLYAMSKSKCVCFVLCLLY
jgi:hypothetical protein